MDNPVLEKIPPHLQEYITEQNPALYTPIDHAAWRYIMRVSKKFFARYGHPMYLRGLEATGISTERIPLVSEMDYALRQMGWRAVAINGFIPPSVFLEFQSLRILPIACDMRKIENLGYTPTPDIVHEAAGHAPIVADPGYRKYLEAYGEAARNAIISKDDMILYEAINALSEIKESRTAKPAEIETAQKNFEKTAASIKNLSEAALLARMNWWTNEYGLIGPMSDPKIYGAGLLSSVSESYDCLKASVKKIPFSVDCIKHAYDITRPQPELFVAKDFDELIYALDQFAATMAYRVGGIKALEIGKSANHTVTVVSDNGVQFTGILEDFAADKDGKPLWYQMGGAMQVAANDQVSDELTHYKFNKSIVVPLFDRAVASSPTEGISAKLHTSGLMAKDGLRVFGRVLRNVRLGGRAHVLVLESVRIEHNGKIIYEELHCEYPLILASEIPSVFGGAADRTEFSMRGKKEERVQRVKSHRTNRTEENAGLCALYQRVREYREQKKTLLSELGDVHAFLHANYPAEWLLRLEMLEILHHETEVPSWEIALREDLFTAVRQSPWIRNLVERGLELIQ